MEGEAEGELRRMLIDHDNRKIAKSSMRVLEIIKRMKENNEVTIPRSITLEYYKDEVSHLSEREISSFIKKRRSVISRKLSDLQKIRLVMTIEGTERTDGRSIPYYLTLTGIELVNNENIYLSMMQDRSDKENDTVKNEIASDLEYRRKYHSNRIRLLITRIKDELSKIFDNDFIPDSINPAVIKFKLDNLSFKKDTLYGDLKNHLGTFLTFKDLQGKLKEMTGSVNSYLEMDGMVRRIIASELLRVLGMAYSDRLDQIDSFGPNLVDWVVRNLFYINAGEVDLYGRYTKDFNVDKEKIDIGNDKAKRIRIDGAVVMILSINKKESYYTEKIMELMCSIAETPILNHYSKMLNEQNNARDIKNELIHSLEKEIEIPIYPGTCDYLSPSEKR